MAEVVSSALDTEREYRAGQREDGAEHESVDLSAAGEALLAWHRQTERDLPWRGERDPYRIWISETMLQQTRAAVAATRYQTFLSRFPTVFALSEASLPEVLSLWQGLGYYARARNLHKAAGQVVERHGGVFPSEESVLRALSGVGEYTACAVLSMAYDVPVPAVDANLARVLSRVFALHGFVEDNRKPLRALAQRWLLSCAASCPGDFNRALMGMGALICTRRPRCSLCPLSPHCLACAMGEEEILPEKRPKAQKKEEYHTLCLCWQERRVLVRQRPAKGLLGGLYEFPHEAYPEALCNRKSIQSFLEDFGLTPTGSWTQAGESTFAFTHRLWHIRAWQGSIDQKVPLPPDCRFVDAEALSGLPMPSVMEPYRQAALAWRANEPADSPHA